MPRSTHRAALGLLVTALAGCSSTPSYDRQFGAATRANVAAQVLDADAGTRRQTATGMDGAAARSAIERYQRSFSQPASQQPASLMGTR